MAITTKDFTTLVSDQVAAIQASASSLVDLTIGSILRAVVDANAAIMLWLQGMILQLLAITRASTSSGVYLDTFLADFGFARLPAVNATGQVMFSRFTATNQAIIPLGTGVQTADGTQAYIVVADTANPNFSQSLNAYTIAAGVVGASITVQAVTAGSAANAAIGQINTLTSAVPNVSIVSNAAAFTNGADAESDPAVRVRFVAYIASLAKATKAAVGYAATALLQGVTYTLTENQLYNGTAQLGYFYLVVDDGTGAPSSTFLSSVYNAIDAVRPITVTFSVFAPVVVTAGVSMSITTAAGYDHGATVALVIGALSNYINALPLGTSLAWSRLAQVAYDASPGVTNVSSVLLNGGTADVAATPKQVIKAGTVTVV